MMSTESLSRVLHNIALEQINDNGANTSTLYVSSTDLQIDKDAFINLCSVVFNSVGDKTVLVASYKEIGRSIILANENNIHIDIFGIDSLTFGIYVRSDEAVLLKLST